MPIRVAAILFLLLALAQLPLQHASQPNPGGAAALSAADSSGAGGRRLPSFRLRRSLAASGPGGLPSPPPPSAAHLQMIEWAKAERRAQRWRRTRTELDRFVRECAWISDGYVRTVRLYEALDKVVVFDVRHGTWQGLGDSISRLLNLLRVSRAMGRAGFILSDPCGATQAPRRYATTALSNGTTCEFDLAAFVRGFGPGVDYQWSDAARRRVEKRLGAAALSAEGERVLSLRCPPGAGGPCELRDARSGAVVFSTPPAEFGGAPQPGRELDWLRFLRDDPGLSAEPFLRIELTDMGDLFTLYEQQEACKASGINLPPWWDQARRVRRKSTVSVRERERGSRRRPEPPRLRPRLSRSPPAGASRTASGSPSCGPRRCCGTPSARRWTGRTSGTDWSPCPLGPASRTTPTRSRSCGPSPRSCGAECPRTRSLERRGRKRKATQNATN